MSASLGKLTDKSPKLYDVIVSPVITEKATYASEHGRYVFKVNSAATKQDIKLAVEKLYKVNVVKVNTLVQKGKVKRFRGTTGQRNGYKKAMVRIADGQSLDLGVGS